MFSKKNMRAYLNKTFAENAYIFCKRLLMFSPPEDGYILENGQCAGEIGSYFFTIPAISASVSPVIHLP